MGEEREEKGGGEEGGREGRWEEFLASPLANQGCKFLHLTLQLQVLLLLVFLLRSAVLNMASQPLVCLGFFLAL